MAAEWGKQLPSCISNTKPAAWGSPLLGWIFPSFKAYFYSLFHSPDLCKQDIAKYIND
jgi:hypothetical protein